MDRSSSSRQSARAKQVLNRQNLNASKKPLLQPKPALEPSVDGAQPPDAGKPPPKSAARRPVQRQRQPYTRVKRDKVFCQKCNLVPDGFRGDHELRRHDMSKHSPVVTKFILRDPRHDSSLQQPSIDLKLPLEKCSSCSKKKQYSIDYNAAQHLRRQHYVQKRRKNVASIDEVDVQADGSKGADYPPMDECKLWIQPVRVSNDGSVVRSDASSDDEDEDMSEPQFVQADMPIGKQSSGGLGVTNAYVPIAAAPQPFAVSATTPGHFVSESALVDAENPHFLSYDLMSASAIMIPQQQGAAGQLPQDLSFASQPSFSPYQIEMHLANDAVVADFAQADAVNMVPADLAPSTTGNGLAFQDKAAKQNATALDAVVTATMGLAPAAINALTASFVHGSQMGLAALQDGDLPFDMAFP